MDTQTEDMARRPIRTGDTVSRPVNRDRYGTVYYVSGDFNVSVEWHDGVIEGGIPAFSLDHDRRAEA